MGTLSALLDLSRNALTANQSALDVTAKNVANQNTVGYTREVVNFTADVVTIGNRAVGDGVDPETTAVSQRDRVLEQRVQQQTQTQGQTSARQDALNQLQAIFGLSSTASSAVSTTLGGAIDSLYNSFSALAGAPATASNRQAVISAAGALTAAFQSASSQIASTTSGLSQTAVTVVGKVNSLTAQIAVLNQQIGQVDHNTDAGALEDQRQQAIAELSQYIGLDQTTTENNGITLTTTGGTLLVSGVQSFALQASAAASPVAIYAAGHSTNIAGTITGGQLGGILSVQTNDAVSLTNSLDQLAYAIGTSINAQNALGLDGNGVAGQALFVVPTTATGASQSITLATTDPTRIAAAGTGEGTAGNTNANALASLATTALVGGQSAAGFFSGLLSGLGTAVSDATSDNKVQQATLDQLTSQRNALSGVSLDEEAASLTQYQRSYQAASKLFSIVDTLLEAAINLGVQTTV